MGLDGPTAESVLGCGFCILCVEPVREADGGHLAAGHVSFGLVPGWKMALARASGCGRAVFSFGIFYRGRHVRRQFPLAVVVVGRGSFATAVVFWILSL